MSVLEPNPNNQMTDYVLEKLDKKQDRIRNLEMLGLDMIESGLEFGSHTIYSQALIKVGKSQQQLGKLEKQFVEQAIKGFVRPLTKFLNEDVRTIMVRELIAMNLFTFRFASIKTTNYKPCLLSNCKLTNSVGTKNSGSQTT